MSESNSFDLVECRVDISAASISGSTRRAIDTVSCNSLGIADSIEEIIAQFLSFTFVTDYLASYGSKTPFHIEDYNLTVDNSIEIWEILYDLVQKVKPNTREVTIEMKKDPASDDDLNTVIFRYITNTSDVTYHIIPIIPVENYTDRRIGNPFVKHTTPSRGKGSISSPSTSNRGKKEESIVSKKRSESKPLKSPTKKNTVKPAGVKIVGKTNLSSRKRK